MALRVEPGLSSSVPPLTPSRSADRPIDEAGTVTSSEAAEAGSPSPARRRGARLAAPVGIVGVVVGCLVPWRAAMHSGLSGDVFWQLASGRWMLDHHQILRQDVFSYTVLGRHWLTPEWGYQVLLAAAVRQLGPVAFWLLSAGTATLTVLAVTARCRRYGAGWTWTGIIAITCGAAMAVFSSRLPHPAAQPCAVRRQLRPHQSRAVPAIVPRPREPQYRDRPARRTRAPRCMSIIARDHGLRPRENFTRCDQPCGIKVSSRLGVPL